MEINILNGKYVNPEDINYYMEIKNGEYIIDYGDDEEIETGKIEIIENDIYTVEEDKDIEGYFFKYKIGTIKNNKIIKIYKFIKTTNKYNRYVLEADNSKKTLDIYKDETFEFKYEKKSSIDKVNIYKSGIYKRNKNEISLIAKTTYEKNIFNKKINEKKHTELIGDNYFIDNKLYVDENNDLYSIEFEKI
jgi:hypothetical protein